MGLIGWIILGGLAGWVASMIMGNDKQQGLLGNIIVGIIGAGIGGFVVGFIGGEGITGFNIWSFVVALLGAIILIWLWRLVTGKKTEQK